MILLPVKLVVKPYGAYNKVAKIVDASGATILQGQVGSQRVKLVEELVERVNKNGA